MYKRKKPIQLPTDREISLLLSKIKDPRTKLIVVLALKLGLRATEITKLQISGINWGNKTISFIGKGNRQATLPLSDEVAGYFERALKIRPISLENENGYVIWNTRKPNEGVSRFNIYYLIRKYGEDAGLKLWPHLLRHKLGTDVMIKRDIYRAKEALRHKNLKTTVDTYAHLDVESQREDFDSLDSRHWMIRFLSKFKPSIPSFLLQKPVPDFTGDTIGRKEPQAKLKENLKAGIHTAVCGPRGCGKSHLLRDISGPGIYHLDDVKPPKVKLLELCEQMKRDGIVQEITGKATTTVLKSLKKAVNGERYIIVIDSLDDITQDGIALLRKLKEDFTIFAAIDIKYRNKLKDIFFGSHDVVEVDNLKSEDAFILADMASVDLLTTPEDREPFLKRVVAESKGNPKGIMEIIDKERRRGKVVNAATLVSHEAIQEPLPAKLFLRPIGIITLLGRYISSSIGMPDLKIIFTGVFIAVLALLVVDAVLEWEVRK
jgi:hypothetical protein